MSAAERYMVRVRRLGCRNWLLLPGEHKTKSQAYQRLGRVMADGNYKRGDILVIAGLSMRIGAEFVTR